MHVVIPVGGNGDQMRPLSAVTPPSMLPVVDRPIAAHVADVAISAGGTALVFATADRDEHVRDYFGGRYDGVPVMYVDTAANSGTAAAIRAAAGHVDDRFGVLDGATIYDPDAVVALFERAVGVSATTAISGDGGQPRPHNAPSEPPTDPPFRSAGAFVLPTDIVPVLERRARDGPIALTDVLAVLDDTTTADVEWMEDWVRIRRPTDLFDATTVVLDHPEFHPSGRRARAMEGTVLIDRTATVDRDVTAAGPVYVGNDVVVGRESELHGPVALGAQVAVGEGVYLDRVIALPGATIPQGARVSDTVIGPGCTLGDGSAIGGITDESRRGTAAIVSRSDSGSHP